MAAFPILALALGLIAIGTLGGRLNFDERRRDRIFRRICLYAGVLILIGCIGMWFL